MTIANPEMNQRTNRNQGQEVEKKLTFDDNVIKKNYRHHCRRS